MVQVLLIAIGAGAAAALLFASLASGSLLAVLLFYLSPLPILIAAVGFSHWAGLLAAALAAAGLGLVLGGWFFAAFLIGIGLPAWWLGYLTLLARPHPDGTLEWYPTGKLVLWAALLGTFVVLATIVTGYGTEAAAFRHALRDTFADVMRVIADEPASTPIDAGTERVLDVLVVAAPPAAAVMTTVVNLINLWLAARVARVSGRLRRPWPDLTGTALPMFAPALLALGLGFTFLPGLANITGAVLAASMLMAYAIVGLAVLHAITRGLAARGLVLGGTYAAVLVLGWPTLVLTLLGLLDTALNLRRRVASARARKPDMHS
jgi:hypothetical protein